MPKNVRSLNLSSEQKSKAPPDDKPAIFVRGELDDYGLNLYEFRVLAHVARRESKEFGCYESQAKMAENCGMSQRMVLEVLRVLCESGILSKEKAEGKRTNSYRVNKGSKWKHPSFLESIRSRNSALDSE